MKVLLDTHALLWLITGDDRLSENARQIFLNEESRLFFSAASLWGDLHKKKPREDIAEGRMVPYDSRRNGDQHDSVAPN